MAFTKGDKRINRAGRPAEHRDRTALRERISSFLSDNLEQVQEDILSLPARDRARAYLDLLPFGLPELKSVEITERPYNGGEILLPTGERYKLS